MKTAANWFASAAVVIPIGSSRLGPATVFSTFDRLALNRRAIKLAWEVAVYGCSNFH